MRRRRAVILVNGGAGGGGGGVPLTLSLPFLFLFLFLFLFISFPFSCSPFLAVLFFTLIPRVSPYFVLPALLLHCSGGGGSDKLMDIGGRVEFSECDGRACAVWIE